MALKRFIFNDTEGNTISEWTIRDIGHEIEENHATGTIVVLKGKRFEIIGSRYLDHWTQIKIVWPYTP